MADITLPQEAENIINTLRNAGYKAYAVGGCVRDFVMGITPVDYDITTNAEPLETKEVFKNAKIIETGIKHGTVTVIQDGFTAEVTTFRIDGKYSDSRHPEKVEFCGNLKEDLKRRDFTVNALAFNSQEGLIDYFGGTEDIKNKIIRCVGEPKLRFEEDALRILRALRFSSVLGFDIESRTREGIFNSFPLIKNISAERIFEELKKLFLGKNVYRILLDYKDVISYVIPQIPKAGSYEQMCLLVSAVKPELKIPALYYFCTPEDAKQSLKALKADNKTINLVVSALSALPKAVNLSEAELLKLLSKHGKEAVCSAMELKKAYCLATEKNTENILNTEKRLKEILDSGSCYRVSELSVNGNDLITLGITDGKLIGNILSLLLEEVMKKRLINSKDALIQRAKEYILKR